LSSWSSAIRMVSGIDVLGWPLCEDLYLRAETVSIVAN